MKAGPRARRADCVPRVRGQAPVVLGGRQARRLARGAPPSHLQARARVVRPSSSPSSPLFLLCRSPAASQRPHRRPNQLDGVFRTVKRELAQAIAGHMSSLADSQDEGADELDEAQVSGAFGPPLPCFSSPRRTDSLSRSLCRSPAPPRHGANSPYPHPAPQSPDPVPRDPHKLRRRAQGRRGPPRGRQGRPSRAADLVLGGEGRGALACRNEGQDGEEEEGEGGGASRGRLRRCGTSTAPALSSDGSRRGPPFRTRTPLTPSSPAARTGQNDRPRALQRPLRVRAGRRPQRQRDQVVQGQGQGQSCRDCWRRLGC